MVCHSYISVPFYCWVIFTVVTRQDLGRKYRDQRVSLVEPLYSLFIDIFPTVGKESMIGSEILSRQ